MWQTKKKNRFQSLGTISRQDDLMSCQSLPNNVKQTILFSGFPFTYEKRCNGAERSFAFLHLSIDPASLLTRLNKRSYAQQFTWQWLPCMGEANSCNITWQALRCPGRIAIEGCPEKKISHDEVRSDLTMFRIEYTTTHWEGHILCEQRRVAHTNAEPNETDTGI